MFYMYFIYIVGMFLSFQTNVFAQSTVSLVNPLDGSASDIPELIEIIIDAIVDLMLPIIFLMIIYAGYLFVIAQGDTAKLSQAKKTLLYAAIGAAVFLAADLLATVIVNTIGGVTN